MIGTWKRALAPESQRLGWRPDIGEHVTAKGKIERAGAGEEPAVADVPGER